MYQIIDEDILQWLIFSVERDIHKTFFQYVQSLIYDIKIHFKSERNFLFRQDLNSLTYRLIKNI